MSVRDTLCGVSSRERREQDGRVVVNRAELVEQLGMAEPTLARLYTQRATTGHPEVVHREGRRLFFDEAQMRVWAAVRIDAKRAGLTEVDRGGDPDELVDVDEAAPVLGYAKPAHHRLLPRMGEAERRGLSPLFWTHVNPYGRFRLDMSTRLDLTAAPVREAIA